MIDIIIPAYNAHNTIEDTLHSIAMQVNKEELCVIIVNDGGKDYKEIIDRFKQWLNIKEIKCPCNCGPGYARNYGIENSNSEYIFFMDADDTLAGSYALSFLKIIANNSQANLVVSHVTSVGKDPESGDYFPTLLEPNFMWLFGNLYRRDFLNKYNIRFLTTCYNEDVGFNAVYATLSCWEHGEEKGIAFYNAGPSTYEWRWNDKSISRDNKQDELSKGLLGALGYAYSELKVCNFLEQYIDKPFQLYTDGILIGLFSMYQNNGFIVNQTINKQASKNLEILCRHLYYKYYDFILSVFPQEYIKEKFEEHFNNTQSYILLNFEEFLDLMFSKPLEEYNEQEIELQLFKSK